MTAVDCATRCIVEVAVVWERTTAALQTLLDARVWVLGHQAVVYKSQTDAVEGDNAELRYYLARLGRASRCFSRSIDALRTAVRLFIYAWNRRQLYQRAHPRYPAHVCDFVSVGV
jgi:hypothetical protein